MCRCESCADDSATCLSDTEINLIGYRDCRLEFFLPLEEALILRDCIHTEAPAPGRYETCSGEILHELCPQKVGDHPKFRHLRVFADLAGGPCRHHNQTTNGRYTETGIWLSAGYVNQTAKNGDIVRLGKVVVYVKTAPGEFTDYLESEGLYRCPDDNIDPDIRLLKHEDVLT